MEWFVFWLIVNCIVGYLIGKPKNNIGTAITVSILLGPIGWLIAALSKGDLRKCPNCAEFVKPEAKICHHCRSELLPKLPVFQPFWPDTREERTLAVVVAAISIGLIVVGFWPYLSPSFSLVRTTTSLPAASPTVAPRPTDPEFVTLSTAINIPVGNYGFPTLQAGHHVKFISRSGQNVRIRYMDADYEIPVDATDLAT